MQTRYMKKLECPKCLGELREVTVASKKGDTLRIDQCFACKGLWFDARELRKTRKSRLIFKDPSRSRELAGEWREVIFDLKAARCPRCNVTLRRKKGLRGIPFALDLCSKCRGTWLDGGEIRFLIKGNALGKIVRYLVYRLKDEIQKRPLGKSVQGGPVSSA